ncbi:FAD-dependent thymidylate synthase [Haladaptatus caseinilyticus]|uniref:FAD-dependent thymidylate synthase n=1 Tax=Haladaptatus caseinilyticus TaxID=2993314 RepID=UPI0038992BAA
MREFNADLSFEQTMASVEGEPIKEKKRTFIAQLLQHGHYCSFEHLSITFAVEGKLHLLCAFLTCFEKLHGGVPDIINLGKIWVLGRIYICLWLLEEYNARYRSTMGRKR